MRIHEMLYCMSIIEKNNVFKNLLLYGILKLLKPERQGGYQDKEERVGNAQRIFRAAK